MMHRRLGLNGHDVIHRFPHTVHELVKILPVEKDLVLLEERIAIVTDPLLLSVMVM